MSSALNVNAVGYVTFETPDLPRLTEYYTTALGFVLLDSTPDTAYLSSDGKTMGVVLEKGSVARARARLGYVLDNDLGQAAGLLATAGLEYRRATDMSPGEPEVLIVNEPETGVPIHLTPADATRPPAKTTPTSTAPTKLGHVAAYTSDLDRMQHFYRDVLGFKWSDTIGDFFVFMRCNTDHHAANFMKSTKYSGMHHVAYEMRDLTHLQTMLDHLAANGYRLDWGPGRHGPGHNIFTYHHDPDGNVIELFTQLDVMDESSGAYEPRPWHQDHPQVPKTWEADLAAQNSWGPGNPTMRDR
jgi:catechol 2,3-dioxygenase-like lactoylglutathione lyase family enzyme